MRASARRATGMTCCESCGRLDAELLELVEQAQLQVSPLAHGLALIVALLPAMQAVFGGTGVLQGRGPPLVRGVGHAQAVFEALQHRRNVVVELGARQTGEGRQLRIARQRFMPGAQNLVAPLRQIAG